MRDTGQAVVCWRDAAGELRNPVVDLSWRGEAGKEPPGAFSCSLKLILSSDVALEAGPSLTIPISCPAPGDTDGSLTWEANPLFLHEKMYKTD